ncbi:MAG TPA: hypothetical protein VFO16_01525 [Pseudonocardiaceae bacterium]|nr:hypothetical protein [Pseudonocardiaceae bacterium]
MAKKPTIEWKTVYCVDADGTGIVDREYSVRLDGGNDYFTSVRRPGSERHTRYIRAHFLKDYADTPEQAIDKYERRQRTEQARLETEIELCKMRRVRVQALRARLEGTTPVATNG